MNQTQLISASMTSEFGIITSPLGKTEPAVNRIDERVAELRAYLGGLAAGASRNEMAELPGALAPYTFAIPRTTIKINTLGFTLQQALLDADERQRTSPLWLKIGSVMVLLLLAAGVIATIFDRNAFTTALVPLGFTFWASLATVIRSRNLSS